MRPQGWEHQLSLHIHQGKTTPFAWGKNDCVLWCADWVLQMRGEDYAAQFRGAYSDEAGARVVLQSLGCASIADLVDRHLDPIAVNRAGRGDVMLHPQGMLGVCDGANTYFLTQDGVTRIAFDRCVRAWRA